MERGLFNITSATTTELIPVNSGRGNISAIWVSNCSAANAITVRVFLTDGTNEVSYIENLGMPAGTTLLLNENVAFDNGNLALKILTAGTMGATHNIQIMIK